MASQSQKLGGAHLFKQAHLFDSIQYTQGQHISMITIFAPTPISVPHPHQEWSPESYISHRPSLNYGEVDVLSNMPVTQ